MQHLDEGTIHAWLDGELPPSEREAVEAHISSCEQCAATVAEARGFVAASSRILTALDTVPGGVLPAAQTGSRWTQPAGHRRLVPSRAWMAAAAVLVLSTVTVIAIRPHGDADQLLVGAAMRRDTEQAATAAPSEEKAQAVQPNVGLQAADSHAVGAAAPAGNADSRSAPATMQSRAAVPANGPKPVDQTERLKQRLEAERQSTLVRPGNKAPAAMAEAVSPLRTPEPAASKDRPSGRPAAPPMASAGANEMTDEREAAASMSDSMAARTTANARDVTISGRVTNETGTPLAAASVAVAGTGIAALTHDDGSYELLIPAARAKGQATSLVARLIGYKTAAVPLTPRGALITHDFVLTPSPVALSEVVVSGAGVSPPRKKLGATSAGTNESPAVVSSSTSTEGEDTVVTTVYAVHDGTVTLIERTSADALRRQKGNADFSDQLIAKAREDTRINSLTWSDSAGHTRTLRGAVSREDLERIRTALFGPTP